MTSKIDLIIPTFNGRHLLEKYLPLVIKHTPHLENLIIIDDASTDRTEEFLKSKFPQITYLRNNKNLGYVKSVNLGFRIATSDYVVLLNNDVYPKKDYLKSALKFFSDPQVAAVTFNEENSSWPLISWRNGKLQFIRGEDKSFPIYSGWASGGSAISKLATWKKLGGYDEVYSPGYWEDIDYGWRVWKSGQKIVWDPNSLVVHQHESTFNTLNPGFVSDLKQSNELVFLWKNITDPNLKLSHFLFLLKYSLFHPGFLRIIFKALLKYPRARKAEKGLSDRHILKLINHKLP